MKPVGRADLAAQLVERGVCAVAGKDICAAAGEDLRRTPDFDRFTREWNELPLDPHLNGGRHRYRRYGRLRAEWDGQDYVLRRLADAPFVQIADRTFDVEYNEGKPREFAPATAALVDSPALSAVVRFDLAVISLAMQPVLATFVGLHFVRVVAAPGEGSQPVLEGRHHDGHDFIGMHIISRHDCRGATSLVYDGAAREPTFEKELEVPLDGMIVDDRRMEHDVTPLVATSDGGYRDMLFFDFEGLIFDSATRR